MGSVSIPGEAVGRGGLQGAGNCRPSLTSGFRFWPAEGSQSPARSAALAREGK